MAEVVSLAVDHLALYQVNKTPGELVSESSISNAILQIDDIRRSLMSIHYEKATQETAKSNPVPAAKGDISEPARAILAAPAKHPGPVKDLGTGTGQPASWRKGFRKPRPSDDPTGTA